MLWDASCLGTDGSPKWPAFDQPDCCRMACEHLVGTENCSLLKDVNACVAQCTQPGWDASLACGGRARPTARPACAAVKDPSSVWCLVADASALRTQERDDGPKTLCNFWKPLKAASSQCAPREPFLLPPEGHDPVPLSCMTLRDIRANRLDFDAVNYICPAPGSALESCTVDFGCDL